MGGLCLVGPGSPYVYERQVEYWTNFQIQHDLVHQGFDVFSYPVTQALERTIGVDVLFSADRVKLFGLQHKSLYRASGDDYWPLTPKHQLDTLRRTDWAYYCLSDAKSLHDWRRALNLARFVRPTSFLSGQHRQVARDLRHYMRWGAFQNRLAGCVAGIRLESKRQLHSMLGESGEALELLDAIVLMSWTSAAIGDREPSTAVVMSRAFEFAPFIDDQVES